LTNAASAVIFLALTTATSAVSVCVEGQIWIAINTRNYSLVSHNGERIETMRKKLGRRRKVERMEKSLRRGRDNVEKVVTMETGFGKREEVKKWNPKIDMSARADFIDRRPCVHF
jgi:hypothetical protein